MTQQKGSGRKRKRTKSQNKILKRRRVKSKTSSKRKVIRRRRRKVKRDIFM
jgi:hypothetical protein